MGAEYLTELPRTRTMLPGCRPAVIGGPKGPASECLLRVECPECRRVFNRVLNLKEREDVVELYRNGGFHPAGHVQHVFPGWTPDDRELFLQSHLCADCWNRVMGGGE